jgi:hypothetical protein
MKKWRFSDFSTLKQAVENGHQSMLRINMMCWADCTGGAGAMPINKMSHRTEIRPVRQIILKEERRYSPPPPPELPLSPLRLPIMAISGKNMAITMLPTITARKTIMMGSRSEVMAATELSTSSS